MACRGRGVTHRDRGRIASCLMRARHQADARFHDSYHRSFRPVLGSGFDGTPSSPPPVGRSRRDQERTPLRRLFVTVRRAENRHHGLEERDGRVGEGDTRMGHGYSRADRYACGSAPDRGHYRSSDTAKLCARDTYTPNSAGSGNVTRAALSCSGGRTGVAGDFASVVPHMFPGEVARSSLKA